MEDIRSTANEENLESSATREEMETFDEVTHEPESRIESVGDFQTAESIEATFKELTDKNQETSGSRSSGVEQISKIDSFTREGELRESVIGEDLHSLGSSPGVDISENGVPDLEAPPIVDISEEGGYVKQMDDISKDPAYLTASDGSSKDPADLVACDGSSKDPANLTDLKLDSFDTDSSPLEGIENDESV
jgi:hypothetical protein